MAALEACWANAVLIGIAGSGSPLLPFWAPFILLIGCYWLAQSLLYAHDTSDISDTTSRKAGWNHLRIPLGVVLLVGVLLFSLWSGAYSSSSAFWNPVWFVQLVSDLLLLQLAAFRSLSIVVIALFFCWRGTRLAHAILEPGFVLMAMRLGFGVIVAVICLQVISHSTSPQEILLFLLVPLFLFLSLMAHALAKSSFVRTSHTSSFQGSVKAQERAILGVTATFGGILFLLTLFASIFATSTFLGAIQWVATRLLALYDKLAIAVAFIMALIATPIIGLLSLLHFRLKDPQIQTKTSQVLCMQHPSAAQCKLPPPARSSYEPLLLFSTRLLLPLLVLVLLVLLVLLLRQRRRRRISRPMEEMHESLWSWTLLWQQVKELFKSLWNRLFPSPAMDILPLAGISEESKEPTTRSIREVYRALLTWAARRGYPRKRGETPFEFRARLRQHIPSSVPEVDIVTEAYTAIRYGRVVPSNEEVLYIQQTWQRLRDKS